MSCEYRPEVVSANAVFSASRCPGAAGLKIGTFLFVHRLRRRGGIIAARVKDQHGWTDQDSIPLLEIDLAVDPLQSEIRAVPASEIFEYRVLPGDENSRVTSRHLRRCDGDQRVW